MKRCDWAESDSLMQEYHDREWGVPVRNDQILFEFLVLESFQAGLSWRTILSKRENFKKAFASFNPQKIAQFTLADANRLMNDPGIVRNRAKILAAINNAKKFLVIQKEFGSFSTYMWKFVKNKTIQNQIRKISDYKPVSEEAVVFAKDLKQRGFKFLGPTTIYAHMQAVGMVNDHMIKCFRRKKSF